MTWTPVPGVRVVAYAKALLYAFVACAVCLLIGLGAGAWVGKEWQQGRDAQLQVATLRQSIKDIGKDLSKAQGAVAQISRDSQATADRINGHSKGLADDLERNRLAAVDAATQLEQAIARDPAGTACAAGPDFLRAWNAANRGDSGRAVGAGQPDRADRRGPDGAVSAGAATRGGREPGGPGPQPQPDRADLPRLQGQQSPPGRRRPRSRAHGAGAHRAGPSGTGAEE